ncbi:MAG: GGDEF domain-containing protein [Ketobacter sp.]|nr:GGDEF domain-containing protein [Ketobacter sp.]
MVRCLLGAVCLMLTLLMQSAYGAGTTDTWYYLQDRGLSVTEVATSELEWQRSLWQAPNLGFTQHAYWFRYAIPSVTVQDGSWYLWLHNAILTEVDVWVQRNQMPPVKVQPAAMRMPAYPLRLESGSDYVLYLRIQSNTALQLPAELVTETELLTLKEEQDSLFGLFVGILFSMMLYNLVLYVSVRDKSFLLYVGHACALLFFVFSWQGLGSRYLWPHWPAFQNMSVALSTFSVIGFSTWFCGVFLSINQHNFKGTWVFWLVRNLGFMGLLVTPFMPYSWAIFSSSFLSFFAVLMVISAMVARVSLRHRPSRLFVMGWTMYVIGALVMGLNKFGLIEVTPTSENLILWGAVFDMVLLCIALGDKFHDERNLKIRAQEMAIKAVRREKNAKEMAISKQQQAQRALQEAADAQDQYARLLERRVRERTLELKRTQQNLEHVSELDALTKLKNRRYLVDRLQQELKACKDKGRSFAIVMVDIDHFKQVNDSHGHLAGDECIRSVGRLMQDRLRNGVDIVCRYGGEEFVLILPDTREAEAMVKAENIRSYIAQTPILCEHQRIMVTISVGVMVVDPDAVPARSEEVIQQADQALYQAKHQGRNCVCLA